MPERVEDLTTAVVVLLVDCQCDRTHLISRKAKCLDIEVGWAPVFSFTARVCLSLFSGARARGGPYHRSGGLAR